MSYVGGLLCGISRCSAPDFGAQTSHQQGTKGRTFVQGTRETKEEHDRAVLLSSPLWQREQANVFTGQFRQWPTCTLTASKIHGWTSLSQHTFKRKKKAYFNCLLCIWLFVRCWNYPLYFNIGRKEMLQLFPLRHVSPFFFFIFAFTFVLGLQNKAVNFKDTQQGKFGGPSTVDSSLCKVSFFSLHNRLHSANTGSRASVHTSRW